jgi:methyl-accepting chemotaxis protein
VQQAAAGTREVTSNIAGVSAGANDTGTAAGRVLEASGEVSRQAEQLKSEVGLYIAGVKAA